MFKRMSWIAPLVIALAVAGHAIAQDQPVDPRTAALNADGDAAFGQRISEWAQNALQTRFLVPPIWQQSAALMEAAKKGYKMPVCAKAIPSVASNPP